MFLTTIKFFERRRHSCQSKRLGRILCPGYYRAYWPCLVVLLLWAGCKRGGPETVPEQPADTAAIAKDTLPARYALYSYVLAREVRIKDYFAFIDQLVTRLDSLTPYPLTEHLLVHANPWIIDTLEDTDYYRRMERDEFVYDQRQMVILRPGDTLRVPDTLTAREIQQRIDSTWLDLNIPEFRLRIVDGSDTLHSILVRVGQNKKRFQQVLGRMDDLRTRPGQGTIIRINRTPTLFVDPHTGRRLKDTKRDDNRRTHMPMIPWIEPEVNGQRLGQLIHPTTNPSSLGKAASNGCIGCSEADAWRLYYHAPLGTRISIRYDLDVPLPDGDTLRLPDIYGWRKKKK